MRKLNVVFILLAFIGSANAGSLEYSTGTEFAVINLLLSKSDFDVRLAAKAIYRMETPRQSITDLAAEVAWTACADKRAMNTDTLSWLAKALGRTKQARYAGVLEFCLSKVSDKKVQKYISEARNLLQDGNSTPFEYGKMDLTKVQAQLARNVPTASSKELAEKFATIHRGQSLDQSFAIFGVPTAVKGVEAKAGRSGGPGFSFQTYQFLTEFTYKGLGAIRFAYDDDKASFWFVEEATSEKGLIWKYGPGRFFASEKEALEGTIRLGNAAELKEVANQLLDMSKQDRQTLDLIAERLYQSRNEKDDKLVDSLAWLSKVIAKSKDGRYKQFLQDLSTTAAHKTLRKYAGKASAELPDEVGEKFVPSLSAKP
jgi:hypothetical protein